MLNGNRFETGQRLPLEFSVCLRAEGTHGFRVRSGPCCPGFLLCYQTSEITLYSNFLQSLFRGMGVLTCYGMRP